MCALTFDSPPLSSVSVLFYFWCCTTILPKFYFHFLLLLLLLFCPRLRSSYFLFHQQIQLHFSALLKITMLLFSVDVVVVFRFALLAPTTPLFRLSQRVMRDGVIRRIRSSFLSTPGFIYFNDTPTGVFSRTLHFYHIFRPWSLSNCFKKHGIPSLLPLRLFHPLFHSITVSLLRSIPCD